MKKTLLGLVAVACIVVPAMALAAQPKPDSQFTYCESRNKCPLDFTTNSTGSKLKKLNMYAKCSQVPVGRKGFFPPVPVNDEGEFTKKGSIENVIGETVNYEIEGKFKKAGKAVGTFKMTTGDCRDAAHDFVALRTGPAQ